MFGGRGVNCGGGPVQIHRRVREDGGLVMFSPRIDIDFLVLVVDLCGGDEGWMLMAILATDLSGSVQIRHWSDYRRRR